MERKLGYWMRMEGERERERQEIRPKASFPLAYSRSCQKWLLPRRTPMLSLKQHLQYA